MDTIPMLLVGLVAPKLKLDSMSTLYLSKLADKLSNAASISDVKDFILNINILFYIIPILCMLGYFGYSKYNERKLSFKKSKRYVYKVTNSQSVGIFSLFFKYFPEAFGRGDINDGSPSYNSSESTIVLPSSTTKFTFENIDPITQEKIQYTAKFNIEEIETEETTNSAPSGNTGPGSTNYTPGGSQSTTKVIKKKNRCIVITLNNSNYISYTELFKIINKKVCDYQASLCEHRITLYGTSIVTNVENEKDRNGVIPKLKNITSKIIDSPRRLFDKQMVFDTYFSPDKDIIKKYFKLNTFNLILYGPPGTGKSGLIRMAALYLERHIISIDLKSMTKEKAYQIFATPYINDSGSYRSKDVIIVLEEFDDSINYLYQKEKYRNAEKDDMRFKNKLNKITLFDKFDKTEDKEKENNCKDDKDGDGDGDGDDMESDDDSNMSNMPTISRFNKKNKFNKNKFGSILSSSKYFKYKDDKNIELKDLLALFQSCIPREGQIIIATTNHFESMYKKIPELFRPGRLTPFKVDFLNKETITELVKYYFDKESKDPEIDLDLPENHTIPTSFLIEMAKLSDGNFKWFKQIVDAYEYNSAK